MDLKWTIINYKWINIMPYRLLVIIHIGRRIWRKGSKPKHYFPPSSNILPANSNALYPRPACVPHRRTARWEITELLLKHLQSWSPLFVPSLTPGLKIVIITAAEDVWEYFDASSDRMDSMKGIILARRKTMTGIQLPWRFSGMQS